MPKWLEQYKEHFLICDPYLRADGRFSVNLVIEKHDGSGVDVVSGIRVTPGDFATEEDAANAARIAGRQWIDNNG